MNRVTIITIISCTIIACVSAAMTQQDRDTTVADHNAERAVYGLPNLSYNMSIEASAQAHADKCVFQHSGTDGLGENIFAGSGSYGNMATADSSWASEKNDWNCQANTCPAVCGHYTQMVWASTTQIGCGLTNCGGNVGTFIVCQFYPPGNYAGERPFDSSKCSMATAPKAPQNTSSPSGKTPVKASSAALVSIGAVSLITLSVLSGSLYAFGNSQYGQICDGQPKHVTTPREIKKVPYCQH